MLYIANTKHTTHSIHMVFTEKNIRKKTHARDALRPSIHRSSGHRKIMHKTQERSKNIILYIQGIHGI